MTTLESMSLAGGPPKSLKSGQKLAVFLGLSSVCILLLATFGFDFPNQGFWLTASLTGILLGVIGFSWATYTGEPMGIKNHGVQFKSISGRGLWAWALGIVLTGFYIVLYFFPEYLGLVQDGPNRGLISLFDPLSRALSGNPASQWFVYGTLYTLAILAFGIKFLWKYRHNRYQRLRTLSVMFFQTAFAFIIPEIMARLNGDLPYYDLKNIWPLNYYNFERYRVNAFIDAGDIGLGMLIFGVLSILVITPLLTYFYGKRWYCSWVCGCGGLAETAGDSFRQLSDKSTFAWKVERWVVHSVLVFVVLMTTAVIYSYLGSDNSKYWLSKSQFLIGVGVVLTAIFTWVMVFRRKALKKDAIYGAAGYMVIILGLLAIHGFSDAKHIFIFSSESLRKTYSFLIGSIFSGVIGTGFYPIFGNRVWCRFGCPMAAILGLQQRLFSRFRITTNGGQCISCGNCSTYCEMGIDVRAYAQKGANIVRASCVGCGICSAVCPRGVLKLENGPLKGRINPREVLLGNDVNLMELANQNSDTAF
ncbi:MAG: 4Fe-4S dicluster domain-containing protein [Robiginitalea sp.]|uniref:4Fe-4S binding protein n=1 Tax=Robiginitalea sp. TaxID=1902411 RepID=UPI003C75F5AE